MKMQSHEHAFLTTGQAERIAQMFKALADPTRVKILFLLSQEECSVNHVAELLEMSQSAVSHQLSYLRNIRLVKHRREGHTVYYSCDDEHVISLLNQAVSHADH